MTRKLPAEKKTTIALRYITMAKLQSSISISSDLSLSSESDSGKSEFSSPEEELLYYARNGFAEDVQNLLQSCAENSITVNINCKGETRQAYFP